MGTVSVPSSTPVSFQGFQLGIFVFWTERDWSQKSCYGNTIEGVILFLLWCTFMVPSFKNIALIFWEISFIQYFTIFRCKQNDVITFLLRALYRTREFFLLAVTYLSFADISWLLQHVTLLSRLVEHPSCKFSPHFLLFIYLAFPFFLAFSSSNCLPYLIFRR